MNDREQALAQLQWAKETYGPTHDDCLSQAEYRSAAWQVVELNIAIVHWVLRFRRHRQDYDDLASELAITLFNCCYNWDPSRGKFSTFAVACIRNAYLTHISELAQLDLAVRLPQYVQTKSARASHKKKLIEKIGALRESYERAEADEALTEWWARHLCIVSTFGTADGELRSDN